MIAEFTNFKGLYNELNNPRHNSTEYLRLLINSLNISSKKLNRIINKHEIVNGNSISTIYLYTERKLKEGKYDYTNAIDDLEDMIKEIKDYNGRKKDYNILVKNFLTIKSNIVSMANSMYGK